jgi:hypothetical protein
MNMSTNPSNIPRPTKISLLRTLKKALRLLWDRLGWVLVCSLMVFLSTGITLATLAWAYGLAVFTTRVVSVVASIVIGSIFISASCLSAATVAARIVEFDEPSASDLFAGFRSGFGRSIRIGIVGVLGTGSLAANAVFYFMGEGILRAAIGALFLYALAALLCICAYLVPLAAMGETGRLKSEDTGKPELGVLMRNAVSLVMGQPGYAICLALFLVVSSSLLGVTGVGAALLAGGFGAILATQATRDQLVRHGILPALPDRDTPIEETGWPRL